jgi:hypothetical protein
MTMAMTMSLGWLEVEQQEEGSENDQQGYREPQVDTGIHFFSFRIFLTLKTAKSSSDLPFLAA